MAMRDEVLMLRLEWIEKRASAAAFGVYVMLSWWMLHDCCCGLGRRDALCLRVLQQP